MPFMTKHTILFLAANPSGTDPRALDREARSIRAELRRSGYRDRFEFETRWAAEPLDLLRELRELRPAVVHFSGRAGPDGLVFQAADGSARVVSPAAIAEAFGAAGASVRLVVLGACYGDAAAEELLAHVDCVVGMGGEIHDDAARSFAIGFYGALGEQESVAAAYRHGCAAIRLEGLAEVERPQLRSRDGIDAEAQIPATKEAPELLEQPCPYPGMRPYSADAAAHFHGRDVEVEELRGKLDAGEREIYVIGPSASGKSSLVAAGLLPQLARAGWAEDREPAASREGAGPRPFVVRSMRPGEHPTARLREVLDAPEGELADAIAALLAHRADRTWVLIVIDQLEEVFTLASNEERATFLPTLRALRGAPRCAIVFTLRTDFLEACMKSPLWPERRRFSHIPVVPLRGEALRDAIACPARDQGVEIEPELVERLLAEAGTEPGILPLLQETLVQLWDRRRDRTLTLADYQMLGGRDRSGLGVALSRRADATLHALSDEQEVIARRILLRLVSFGEGRADTRRQQPRARLRVADDDPADFDAVLSRLIADRLLVMDYDGEGGEARVDLAHEVMIAAWPVLAGWLQTYRADEARRRQLEAAAAGWSEHGRGARGLFDPIELAEAEAWLASAAARELGVSADVAALVAASQAALAREAEAGRRQARWLAGVAGAGMILLLAVIAATAISVAHAQELELQRDALRTNAYAAHALAGAVAFHLREQVDAVVALTSDPAVARWLRDADHEALERRRRQTLFESFTLLDRAGIVVSNVSESSTGVRNVGRSYAWRNYFVGARRLGEAGLRAGYISRVIRSEDDDRHKFGISAPIYDANGWEGVLMATVGTDFALKQRRLDSASEDGPMAVIVAPQDRSRTSTEGEGEYVVILHEGLAHGAGVVIHSPRLRELRTPPAGREQLRWIDPEPITDDAHHDPVPGYEGRWLAGFAPVGGTGFVVIVQTRYDAAVAPNARLSRRLASRTGIALLAWLALCAAGVWLYRRRLMRAASAAASSRRPTATPTRAG